MEKRGTFQLNVSTVVLRSCWNRQESPTWLRHSYHCAVCGHTNADYPVQRLTLDLSVLSTVQLGRLAEEVHGLLEERQRAAGPRFSFGFRASGNVRIGAIYLAKLSWDVQEQRLIRSFYDLPKRRNAGITSVDTTFTAAPGEIIGLLGPPENFTTLSPQQAQE